MKATSGSKRILIIQGHPDAAGGHYAHALAARYHAGARAAGHDVRIIAVAQQDLPPLRNQADFDAEAPAVVKQCQDDIAWASHLVIFYPLWLGAMPAILKAFFEQVFRPGFAFNVQSSKGLWQKKLTGKSARIVVTMGMPAFVYRFFFGAHSLKSLERNILGFVGIRPVRETLIGMVEASAEKRGHWLQRLEKLGRQGL